MKNLHIEDSYKIWSTDNMSVFIMDECREKYGSPLAEKVLNRTYKSMYIEWYLHNIGYFLTLPFIKIPKIKALNERFKHVDLEEHI